MNDIDNIMVSICCITYNQEKYITGAIESFLMQKTNFKYEILIHDDASTDSTANIVREYQKKYPDIVKPIFQTENQYSKGIKVGMVNSLRAKGQYIALCEGDDYWSDHYKLQKQFDYMESYPECSLCTHATATVNDNNQPMEKLIRPNVGDSEFTTGEIIVGGGGMFATNSMFYPSKFPHSLPEFYINALVGDYPLTIYLAMQGTVHYIDEIMSVYRVQAKGSFSSTLNKARIITMLKANINMLRQIDEYSSYKYSADIDKAIYNNKHTIFVLRVKKINLFLHKYMPIIIILIKKINEGRRIIMNYAKRQLRKIVK